MMGIPAKMNKKAFREHPISINVLKGKLLLRYPERMTNLILKIFFDLKSEAEDHDMAVECYRKGEIEHCPTQNTVLYSYLIKKINAKVIEKGFEGQMRVCFNLYDLNSDGQICATDLYNLNNAFAGNNFKIMQDLLLITKALNIQNKRYWHEKVLAIKKEGIKCLKEKLQVQTNTQEKNEDFQRNLNKVQEYSFEDDTPNETPPESMNASFVCETNPFHLKCKNKPMS
jgi:hypothetical protein